MPAMAPFFALLIASAPHHPITTPTNRQGTADSHDQWQRVNRMKADRKQRLAKKVKSKDKVKKRKAHGHKCDIGMAAAIDRIPSGTLIRPGGQEWDDVYKYIKGGIFTECGIGREHLSGDLTRSAFVSPDSTLLHITNAPVVDVRGLIGGVPRYHDAFNRNPADHTRMQLLYVGNAKCLADGDYNGISGNKTKIYVVWRKDNGQPFVKLGAAKWVQDLPRNAQGEPRYLLDMEEPANEIEEWMAIFP